MRSPSFGNVCSRVAAESVRGGGVEHADAGTDPSSSSLPELNNESDPLPRFGGREVLELEEISVPTPAAGELLIEVERAGVNFVDTREREGTYNRPETHGQGIGLPHSARSPSGGNGSGRRLRLRPPAPRRSVTISAVSARTTRSTIRETTGLNR
jgi:hypothetical protein